MIQAGLPLATTRPGRPTPGASRRLGRRAEGRVTLRVGKVPDGRRDEPAGPVPGEGVGVPHGPASVGADPPRQKRVASSTVAASLAALATACISPSRAVCSRSATSACLRSVMSLHDLDDLERFAGLVADQALLVLTQQ